MLYPPVFYQIGQAPVEAYIEETQAKETTGGIKTFANGEYQSVLDHSSLTHSEIIQVYMIQ